MPTRRFFVTDPPEQPLDEVRFELSGTERSGPDAGKEWVESFLCVDRPSAAVASPLATAFTVVGDDIVVNRVTVLFVIRNIVVDADRERLEELLLSQSRVVDLQDLGEIAFWLMETYAARPTGRRRPPSDGSSPAELRLAASEPPEVTPPV